MDVELNFQRWLNSDVVSKEDKDILKKMSQKEKDDAFFKNIDFGTAGMRGIIGPGTNRINNYTVKKATIGFANYLYEKFPDIREKGIAIAHDNRHMSREFTLLSAKILSEFGIKTYIFDSLRPTPELSFAVRTLGCDGGIMITASHNPKEHNGYKVYDETGCQLTPDKISRLVEIIKELPDELSVSYRPSEHVAEVITIDKTVDDKYIELIKGIQINSDLDKSKFKIVFTPNHGTSYVLGMRLFKELGYNVIPVKSQCEPDPNFSGTLSPNPEDSRSFIEPIKLAKKENADLIVMTDPDGDRVGLGFKDKNGEYQTLTGNQSAPMLMHYMFTMLKERGALPTDGVMYNTVVTSALGKAVADKFNIKTEQFLTGFKYIGSRIAHYEKIGGPKFVFGYEESYGCLVAPFVRDKDGLQAILLYTEMALYYFLQGKTLDVVWDDMGKIYGYYDDKVFNIMFTGSDGNDKMKKLMERLYTKPLKTIDGVKVVKFENYRERVAKTGLFKKEKINLPVTDLAKFYLKDGSSVCIRPSGTEPKVKFYIGVKGHCRKCVEGKAEHIYKTLLKELEINE